MDQNLILFFQHDQIELEVRGSQYQFRNNSWYKNTKKTKDIVNRDCIKRLRNYSSPDIGMMKTRNFYS